MPSYAEFLECDTLQPLRLERKFFHHDRSYFVKYDTLEYPEIAAIRSIAYFSYNTKSVSRIGGVNQLHTISSSGEKRMTHFYPRLNFLESTILGEYTEKAPTSVR